MTLNDVTTQISTLRHSITLSIQNQYKIHAARR